MARGINKVILVGNLGQDPEVRYFPDGGGAVANVSIATTRAWKDKKTDEQKEQTEWHRVVFYGRLAEIVGEYLKKGRQIYIEGRLQTDKWQDKSGNDRYTTKIVANEMQMLGGRDEGSSGGNFGASQPSSAPESAAPASATPAPANNAPTDDFDDDIPF